MKSLAQLLLALLLAAGLCGPAAAGAAVPQLSAGERAAMAAALRGTEELAEAPAQALDDEALWTSVVRHATAELGLRVRPASVDRFWAIQPPVRDVAAELAAARDQGRLEAWLAGLPPPFPQYRALRAARHQYATLVDNGGWRDLPSGPSLREGDRHEQVALLRARLAVEGYGLAVSTEPQRFDGAVRGLITDFQQRHGLRADGVLGPQTRAALNVPAEQRLMQIEANLERWRWLPRYLPADRVEVDIGAAEATLYRAGAPALRMKAVVGDPRHHTPMFASRIEAVVFNPPWKVPASIAAKEIYPKAARDPGYLARNDFHVVDGQLEQRPGPKNALGVLKFDLPSPFGVYLHDTPSKAAFERPDRALSHGCMRLEKPRELALALLSGQGWSAERIEAAIAAGDTARTALVRPVPLYVLYWTVAADEIGGVSFRPDVYGWDAKLIQAMARASAGG